MSSHPRQLAYTFRSPFGGITRNVREVASDVSPG